MKDNLFNYIETNIDEIYEMSDKIFDFAEIGNKEYKSSEILQRHLENKGFIVEDKIGGLDTAFKATYENGSGGPSIGLLCEYDAVEDLGHVCGHHMQGPVIIAAAVALKEIVNKYPFKIVVYGTPAEETSSGKIQMVNEGCFQDIDVALMFHGSNTTTTDIKCMTSAKFEVVFNGKSSHAAIKPEEGRSALDGLLLTFNGIEFMREHVKEDTRMHYSVVNGGGAPNSVHKEASALFYIRSYDTEYLESLIKRFENIVKGASLITETKYIIKKIKETKAKIPVLRLNDLLMENAEVVKAPRISPPREKTGSTDFGNVMYNLPGSCIRVAFVPENAVSHTVEYLNEGKTENAHSAILIGSKILAASSYEIISDEKLFKEIKDEFKANKYSSNL